MCVVCIHECKHVIMSADAQLCADAHAHLCTRLWKPGLDFEYLPQSLSTSFIETVSSTEATVKIACSGTSWATDCRCHCHTQHHKVTTSIVMITISLALSPEFLIPINIFLFPRKCHYSLTIFTLWHCARIQWIHLPRILWSKFSPSFIEEEAEAQKFKVCPKSYRKAGM